MEHNSDEGSALVAHVTEKLSDSFDLLAKGVDAAWLKRRLVFVTSGLVNAEYGWVLHSSYFRSCLLGRSTSASCSAFKGDKARTSSMPRSVPTWSTTQHPLLCTVPASI